MAELACQAELATTVPEQAELATTVPEQAELVGPARRLLGAGRAGLPIIVRSSVLPRATTATTAVVVTHHLP